MSKGKEFRTIAFSCLAAWVWVSLGLQAEESKPAPVNINTATVEELARLPGIGPRIAERIVQHREKNGPFRRVEELLIIRGVNRKKFEKIRPLITVGTEARTGNAGLVRHGSFEQHQRHGDQQERSDDD